MGGPLKKISDRIFMDVLEAWGSGNTGKAGSRMNFKRGLFRIWVVVTVLWIAAWAYYVWDYCVLREYQYGIACFSGSINMELHVGSTIERILSFHSYRRLFAILLGPPIVLLVAGFWVVRGFFSPQSK